MGRWEYIDSQGESALELDLVVAAGGRLLVQIASIQGALLMSTVEVLKSLPTPTRMLDVVPPDTRVVFHDVTWDAYENLVDALGDRDNCRVAFDGKDIEMMTLGPFHERQRSRWTGSS